MTGVAALVCVLALVGLAVMAGRDRGTHVPAKLPVLGGGGAARDSASASSAAPMGLRMRGPVTYEATGTLPVLDAQADAYELPAPVADIERFAALARDLGVDGKVTRTESGWTIGNGSDHLDVQRVGGLPWSRYRADAVTVSSGSSDSSVSSGSSGSSGSGSSGSATVVCGSPCPPDAKCIAPDCAPTEPAPMPEPEPKRPADLPAKAEAERIGRALLTELGVDLDHATVAVQDGFSVWTVNADPVVDGRPVIGMTTSVSIGPKGEIAYANGWLGRPVKGDRYPLIGTASALKKLGEDQVRMLGAPQEMIAPAPAPSCDVDAPCTMPVPPECDPAADCGTTPPEPVVVHITGVALGLQLFWGSGPDQPAYLVPTYLFRTDDGSDLPVIAVDPQYLAPTPAGVEPDGTKGGEPASSPPAAPEPTATPRPADAPNSGR
ncbi:MAG: hypothetical protein QOF40_1975 [Actinomycetota bacterium]|nr:hypothetical protein [Actinomycetota bacterium]